MTRPANKSLRFRQIHLDFHTAGSIPKIGAAFDKRRWQETLQDSCVDSITCFSKCHHGWSYHPTEVGTCHPHLSFDLLRAQFDACKEIDVNVPVYLSAGVDNLASAEHAEWREVGADGRYTGWTQSITDAGFHRLCFHSPYLDFLCRQIVEAVRLFPQCDGIFLDIAEQGQCCCKWCMAVMKSQDLDAANEGDRKKCASLALDRYFKATTDAARGQDPSMAVFHNSGHITRGKTDLLRKYFSHLELESLPTGGWGYDHFPMSAKYAKKVGLDVLGMTGRFHTTWGEFGGYKHPNALRYECGAMLAFGSKCSVGDQLHPSGTLDSSTYQLVAPAYREVRAKEPWCRDVQNVADVAILSSTAVNASGHRDLDSDIGASRVLLEGHFLFDVIDQHMAFESYKMLVLPDDVTVDADLKLKLDNYLHAGGKLFLTGTSGLDDTRTQFLWDCGATCHGTSPYQPDFVLPRSDVRPDGIDSPLVMYLCSQRIRVTDGESLGQIVDPYFNRSFREFCSHQHAPPRTEPSGFDSGVRKGNIVYLAHPIFSLYRGMGAVAYRNYVVHCLRLLLGDDERVRITGLPSTGRVSLMQRTTTDQTVLHLLYANTITRGGPLQNEKAGMAARPQGIEVIEELVPVYDISLTIRCDVAVNSVTLQPSGVSIPFSRSGTQVSFKVDRLLCHEMVVMRS
jgi:Hypothetical glycosyl hydrolase 6/Beta-galactosidase trimerisation domain